MHEYFKEIQKALDDFHKSDRELKPLYMLIKVDVDPSVVSNQRLAGEYALHHCDNMYYELADWYYPDNEQYPYIAK